MRRVAWQTRWRLLASAGSLSMMLLGGASPSAVAAYPAARNPERETVEVSIPNSPRRTTSTAGRPLRSSAQSAAVARTTSYEPDDEMMEPMEPAPRSPAPARRTSAARSSNHSQAGYAASYEQPAPRHAPSRVQRTAMRSRAQMIEEVPAGAMRGGEVIYDDYQPGEMMQGRIIDGDFGGAPPAWNGGDPYMPDVWRTKNWGITVGAEALFLRGHFSQGVALQAITGSQPGATALVQINGINWDNPYQGAFRGYIGLRNLNCGDEIRFSYFNFGSNQNVTAVADESTNYCDFLCNMTANPGDTVATGLNLQMNVYDFDLIRCFQLPQPCVPTCGDGCDDCNPCDSCGPCCPVWDVRWFAGIRFAQVNHALSSSIVAADGTQAVSANSTANFFGVGPRIGLQMRRYFDQAARWSVYGRGSGSLLVGNLDQTINNFNITDPPTQTVATDSFNRVIPVAEIEIGASWLVLPRVTVSGGWLAMAWWDLGLQERVTDYDTSNILGLDGFFVRGEVIF